MAESRGIDLIRQSDTSVLLLAVLFDSANAKITSGTTSARVWHIVPTSGAFETYDFNDNTFKTTAVTTATLSLTHRTAENATYNSGVWTVRMATLTAFTAGDKYVVEVSHTSLPRPITYYWQYGGVEGDTIEPTTAGRTLDVSVGGEAGVDWANVGSPTSTVVLSGTTVKTATDVETDTQDVQTRLPAALVSGRIDASAGAIATGVVNAAAIADDAIDAGAIATGAITATKFAASAIDSTVLAASAIGSSQLATGAITAAKFAAGAIDAAAIADSAIDAGAIATGAITAAKFAASAIDAAAIADGAIDAGAIATGAANKIADCVIRRNSSNVAASADGDAVVFRSLLGAVRKQTNKCAVVTSDLKTYEEDDTTVAGTQAITENSNANPIVGLDTT